MRLIPTYREIIAQFIFQGKEGVHPTNQMCTPEGVEGVVVLTRECVIVCYLVKKGSKNGHIEHHCRPVFVFSVMFFVSSQFANGI